MPGPATDGAMCGAAAPDYTACMAALKRPESVLVVVYTGDDRILLLRRADVHGFWQSVTGSLRVGETPAAAARRELAEETGLDPASLVDCRRRRRFPIRPEWRARYSAADTDNVEHELHLLLPAPREPALNPREHAEARWLPRAAALERAASWTNRAAIRMLPTRPARATVVLVHGLWVGSPSMAILALRLRRAGFAVRLFHYFSTREAPPVAARRLARLVRVIDTPIVHFAAHSLGGIVLSHLFAERLPPRTGRAILLGSPMFGSIAARGMQRLGIDWTLGASGRQGLLEQRPEWLGEVPVAVVVGARPLGLGRLVADLPRPHDGAVALHESLIPGAPWAMVPTSHSGLLFSRQAAACAISWLRDAVLPGADAGDKLNV